VVDTTKSSAIQAKTSTTSELIVVVVGTKRVIAIESGIVELGSNSQGAAVGGREGLTAREIRLATVRRISVAVRPVSVASKRALTSREVIESIVATLVECTASP